MSLLGNTGAAALDKVGANAKLVGQALANSGAVPDYTQDSAEMQKKGFVWNGFTWVKP
jgi:hypothetical protein